jgi:RNA polymerase sigma factor (sigma-70 family)
MISSQTDEELMTGIQKGSQEALLELYTRHSGKVWIYLRKRVPSENVEDLFQDVFVKIVEKKEGWSGQPFLLWFYVVIRNTVMDFYRDKKIESKYLDLLSLQPQADYSHVQIEEMLSSVSKENAKLLREFFAEGRSYKELAHSYELTEVSLRKRLSRAIKILKRNHRDE